MIGRTNFPWIQSESPIVLYNLISHKFTSQKNLKMDRQLMNIYQRMYSIQNVSESVIQLGTGLRIFAHLISQ
jgi:hypothetical protein